MNFYWMDSTWFSVGLFCAGTAAAFIFWFTGHNLLARYLQGKKTTDKDVPSLNRSLTTLPLRFLLLAFIAFMTAGPQLMKQSRTDGALLFVVDVSASISEDRQRVEEYVRARIDKSLNAEGAYGILLFGQDSEYSTPFPTPGDVPPEFHWDQNRPQQMASDVCSALQKARLILSSFGGGTVVLLTDGHVDRGGLLRQARSLAEAGLDLDVVELSCAQPHDVFVRSLMAPHVVRQNTTVPIRAVVENTGVPVEALVQLWDENWDGKPNHREETRYLVQGTQILDFSAPAAKPGLHLFRVAVQPADPQVDLLPANNDRSISLSIVSTSGILLVEGVPGAAKQIEKVLLRCRAKPQIIAASELAARSLEKIDVVALVNVAIGDIPATLVDKLEKYVRAGGGLVVYGGDNAFEYGNYSNSDFENRLLPVVSDSKHPDQERAVGIFLLLIDVSGSMQNQSLQLAKQVATAAIEKLQPGMAVSVISFDVKGYTLEQPRILYPDVQQQIIHKINALSAGGGTDIRTALEAALQKLPECRSHMNLNQLAAHLLIVSDGITDPTGLPELARSFADKDCTVHTVHIGDASGPGQQGRSLMKAIASAGGGRAEIYDGTEMPAFELKEDEVEEQRARLPIMRHPGDVVFPPTIGTTGPGVFDAMVWDYNRTETKSGTRPSLFVQHKNKNKNNPDLYVWHYPNQAADCGKIMTCQIDVEGKWSKGLLESELAGILLTDPLYFCHRKTDKIWLHGSVRQDKQAPDMLVLTIQGQLPAEAVLEAQEMLSDTANSPERMPIKLPLHRTSTHTWQGRFKAIQGQTDYQFQIKNDGKKLPEGNVWVALNPDVEIMPEHVDNQPDRKTLQAAADLFSKTVKELQDPYDRVSMNVRYEYRKPWNRILIPALFALVLLGTVVRLAPARWSGTGLWLLGLISLILFLAGFLYEYLMFV